MHINVAIWWRISSRNLLQSCEFLHLWQGRLQWELISKPWKWEHTLFPLSSRRNCWHLASSSLNIVKFYPPRVSKKKQTVLLLKVSYVFIQKTQMHQNIFPSTTFVSWKIRSINQKELNILSGLQWEPNYMQWIHKLLYIPLYFLFFLFGIFIQRVSTQRTHHESSVKHSL